MSTPPNPPKAWIANLRAPSDGTDLRFLDPIERDALDSAVPFAAEHARRYIATNGKDDGWEGPRPILLLYTTGKKTGVIRRNPLLFLDHAGERFIIGSKGGDSAHPQWFTNLVANPEVHIRVDAVFSAALAEVVDEAVHAQVWPILTAQYEMFAAYQLRTDRQIPLVRLRPIGADEIAS